MSSPPRPAGTTVIALDVDGVLNPDRPDQADPAWGPDWQIHNAYIAPFNYQLTTHPQMMARLADLATSNVEIVWLTTWHDDANPHIGAVHGWPARDVVDWSDTISTGWGHTEGHGNKADGLNAWLADRPDVTRLAWIDDAHTAPGGELHQRLDAGPGKVGMCDHLADLDLLIVAPDHRTGLTVATVDHLHRWVADADHPDPWLVVATHEDTPTTIVAVHTDRAAAIIDARRRNADTVDTNRWGETPTHTPVAAHIALGHRRPGQRGWPAGPLHPVDDRIARQVADACGPAIPTLPDVGHR